MSDISEEELVKKIADRHEWLMNQAMEQFMDQDHADIDTGEYLIHLCYQVPCTHV